MSKHIEKVRELFAKSPVVDISSIERVAGKKYAKLLVSKMRGEIYRVTKGCYSKEDDPSLAVLCFSPAYLGLQSAMSFHGLWEQETIPIIITSRKVRTGLREIFDTNVLVRRSEHIFGYEFYLDGKFYLPYSDIEKTLIDMVLFKERLDASVLDGFMKRLDRKRLDRYLRRYPGAVARQVRAIFK